MVRDGPGQPLCGRTLRHRQEYRSRGTVHLFQLSVGRIPRTRLPRPDLLQRLSPSRGRFPPLPDPSTGHHRRSSAGAERDRDGHYPRRRGPSGAVAPMAGPRRLRTGALRIYHLRVHRRMVPRRDGNHGLGLRHRGPRAQAQAGIRGGGPGLRPSAAAPAGCRTGAIAQQAGVKVLSLPHQGLSAARNTGLSAATGEIAAFIDADAAADRDWLYHLVEAIRRRAAAAAGGPNFPPAASSILAAAIAAAPGQPREVRQSDDSLAQVCGCNMAVVRAVAQSLGGFDPLFTAAGDDVDFSWRLLRARAVIAYAPGAVVTHERRGSIRAYLAQQRGYGAAEALLARKYPELGRRRVYGYDGWQARWLGLPRIYYGAMGRGLFQTIYPAGGQPLVELASSAWWLALSLVLLASGIGGRQSVLIAAGGAGLILTATSAAVYAARARLERQRDRLATRALVALLSILGPAIRSYARIRAALWHALSSPKIGKAGMPRRSGSIRLAMAAREGADQPDRDAVAEQLRYALFRRGLTVEGNTGFEPFDLQIMLGSMVRVPLNTLAQEDGGLYLHWRVAASPIPILIAAAIVLGLIATGQWIAAGAAAAAAIAWCAIVAIAPLSRLPSVLGDGLIEAMDRLQVDATVISEGA